MTVKCSICWEDKCQHFKIKKSIKNKGLFHKNQIIYEIECKCGHTYPFEYNGKFHISKCPNCKFKILVSPIEHDEVTFEKLNSYFSIPRSKCHYCESTGIIRMDKFKTCVNCCGSGGILCIQCNGSGSIHGSSFDSSCDYCRTVGWLNKCQLCNGNKVLVDGRTQYNCNKCHIDK